MKKFLIVLGLTLLTSCGNNETKEVNNSIKEIEVKEIEVKTIEDNIITLNSK